MKKTEQKNEDTTLGITRNTLDEFKKLKLKVQAVFEKEMHDDYFLRFLIKYFNKRNKEIFEIVESIKEVNQIE